MPPTESESESEEEEEEQEQEGEAGKAELKEGGVEREGKQAAAGASAVAADVQKLGIA